MTRVRLLAAALPTAALAAALPLTGGCDGAACEIDPGIQGELVIAGRANPAYSHARWSAEHKQDADPEEDGCLGAVRISFGQSAESEMACALAVSVGLPEGDERRVFGLSVSADSGCRGFPDDIEGVYELTADSAPITVTGLPAAVPQDDVDESCFPTEASFDGVATLEARGLPDAPTLTVDFTGVVVRGHLKSRGFAGAGCQEP